MLKFGWFELPALAVTTPKLASILAFGRSVVVSCCLYDPTPGTPCDCAGHAGALLGSRWFITGGGNNRAGCSDLMALELGGLGRGGTLRWRHVVDVEPRSALASEGLTLLAVPEVGDAEP